MIGTQWFSVHFVSEKNVIAHRLFHRKAAGEILGIILLANLFHFFVRAKKYDFDAALERSGIIEQRGERCPGPLDVADRAGKAGIRAVAGTLKRGDH